MLGHKPKRIRKLQRLRHYDYSSPGWYFITVCTQYMVEWFGDVVNGTMVLNECGEIVKQQLLWLPQQYPHIQLDEWVVMPNHVHAILVIKPVIVGTGLDLSLHTDLSLHRTNTLSLSHIIGAFKTTSSKRIHRETRTHRQFSWQRSYYDHIIRDETALNNIRRYIRNNPKRWHSPPKH